MLYRQEINSKSIKVEKPQYEKETNCNECPYKLVQTQAC